MRERPLNDKSVGKDQVMKKQDMKKRDRRESSAERVTYKDEGMAYPESLEELLSKELSVESGLEFSSDQRFLAELNYRIDKRLKTRGIPVYRKTWFSGVGKGMIAAAAGFFLFISLNLLPQLTVNLSLAGARLLQEKISYHSWNQGARLGESLAELERGIEIFTGTLGF